ncbi:MAG: hypothetical protein WD696_21240 [Bryobacteraceae bacterium]
MADFRKLFLAFTVAALLVSTATTANAQALTCAASAAPNIVRSEGITELLGDIILDCSSGGVALPVSNYNIQVTLNTAFTSPFITDPATDALLTVGNAPFNVSNAYAGRRASSNTVLFQGVRIEPGGTTFTLRVTNIRADAAAVSPSTITATLSTQNVVVGGTALPVSNAVLTVGSPQLGLAFRVRSRTDGSGAPFNILQCADQNEDLAGDPTDDVTASDQGIAFNVQFREQQLAAFKTQAQEAGFTPAASTISNAGGTITTTTSFGQATNGTRLRGVFNNVPTGVQIFVTTRDVVAGTTQTTPATPGVPRAVLVTTDINGAGNPIPAGTVFPAEGPVGSGGTVDNPSTTGPASYNIAQVTINGGTGVAVWEIVTTDQALSEDVSFGVVLAFAAGAPGLGTSTVGGSFAPISTVRTSAVAGSPPSGQPIPRFVDSSTANNAFTIGSCVTNLLFPFVTNQAGFDTGISIANTSQDIFGTAAQTGTCTLNYFGGTAGGGAAPAAQTSQSVPAGSSVVFTTSSGGNLGVAATPGFQGYMIAQCNFRFAHGFAFISDQGARNLAMGYLALVMDPGTAPRDTSSQGESFGQ